MAAWALRAHLWLCSIMSGFVCSEMLRFVKVRRLKNVETVTGFKGLFFALKIKLHNGIFSGKTKTPTDVVSIGIHLGADDQIRTGDLVLTKAGNYPSNVHDVPTKALINAVCIEISAPNADICSASRGVEHSTD